MIREIVSIDENLCDGCGLCVPQCHEGAIRIVNGKARLVDDNLCDGLGACLGHCPRGAITIERREARDFDEAAVAAHLGVSSEHTSAQTPPPPGRPTCPSASLKVFDAPPATAAGGCPGSRMAAFGPRPDVAARAAFPQAEIGRPSELQHWPIQLKLLPATAPVLRSARLLVCADCVPFAYADFHSQMLRDHAVVIACPKLDDTRGYVEKLTQMFSANDLREVSVARMEVPCCSGILHAVLEARRHSGAQTPVYDVVIGVRGDVLQKRELPLSA